MRYSILDKLYLTYCVVRTKLISHKIRLIRFPIDIRGRKHISFGEKFTTGRYCRIEVEKLDSIHRNEKRLIIGNNVQINDFVHITAAEKVVIEDNVLIASKVYISDCSHGSYGKNDIHDNPLSIPKNRTLITSPIHIQKNVWLGDGVCILPGVTIGEGSIIGANSVVNKSIPPYTIAAGIPVKAIKKFNFETQQWEKVV
jgi:acetyltransferase-like isoleucine patch superfamily enzyme